LCLEASKEKRFFSEEKQTSNCGTEDFSWRKFTEEVTKTPVGENFP
jgi:hypothetical protein